ncbi:MAG: MobF family relaxase [Mycobacteriales bacterium]|nr:MobF family relaxase [Mycobacteriales bacterium]
MISIATLAGGASARYYTRADGCERELLQEIAVPDERALARDRQAGTVGYYVNGRDLPGEWTGRGAQALGLSGRLTAEDARVLQDLLEGHHRDQQLARPVWRRDDSGARVDVRRAGFDVTFSAPKSVSTLMALADPAVVEQVLAAHRHAAAEALALLENLSARAARGHQGDGQLAPRIGTDGFVAAAFTHTTSRALDPQLHTHVVIANLARGTDGRWSALDSRTLHREATTASYLYQHRLRAELTERLGVSWTGIDRGVAEVAGIPLGVRREFSTRRRQIEHALEQTPEPATQRGRARHLAAQAACLLTRTAKRRQPVAQLRLQWQERAAAAGFSAKDLTTLLDHPSPPPPPGQMDDALGRVLSPEGVTREAATFGQGALLRELISQLPPGVATSTSELLAATSAAVRTDQVVPVITADGRAYTTQDLLETEAAALTLATRTGPALGRLDPRQVAAIVARAKGLRGEQQQMTFALLTSGRAVEVVTGPAGCGKTAGLAVAADAWHAAGITVTGTAVAALTAQGLEQASGVPAVSLTRTLTQPDRHVPTGGVLLVDEAGMIGTRQLHTLLTLAAERDCKVVLVGDPQQLPELQAGGMFARLTREPTALVLDGHHRQQHPWERDALERLRDGDTITALEIYRQHERLHTSHEADQIRAAAVTAYLTSRAQHADPWQTVLLASTRDDVQVLNEQVRDRLQAAGQLGRRELRIDTDEGQIGFRQGDQVLVTRNDHALGLLNGTTAIVFALQPDGLILRTTSGRDVRVERAWLQEGCLDHGYAMTLHKAQGRTVHTALVVGGDSLSSQAGYVGLSRGTHANHLFLTTRDVHDLTTDCGHAAQHRPPSRVVRPSPLTRDARQRLASELLRRETQRLRRYSQPHRELPEDRAAAIGRRGR